jgi:pimeloyl-ACP methyl ester carboxylesterase
MKQLYEETPVGYHDFHNDVSLNFQLNLRLYNTGLFTKEEVSGFGKMIKDYQEITPLMENLAENSRSQKNYKRAAAFMRLAEFFCFSSENEKQVLYNKYIELFYNAYSSEAIIKHEVPYENGKLPVMEIKSIGTEKGTLVIHGGGDSYMEEFYPFVKPFSQNGFRVILFEGPGQGTALHQYGLKMTHEWEKPVSEVYSFFNLNQVPLIGISLGGYFACRAAAFEKRISKVVLWDAVFDFFECVFGRRSRFSFFVIKTLTDMNAFRLINSIVNKQMGKNPMLKWIMEHSYYVHGVSTAFEYLKKLRNYTTRPVSHKVAIPVLVMTGEDDHIIPFKMFGQQMKTLKNVKDLKGRVYTRTENASAHCQVGNINLAISEIMEWLQK